MNSQFNYSTFVELFLESSLEHEPHGLEQSAPPAVLEPARPDTPTSSPP